MGEKVTTALAYACAAATVNAVKTAKRINAKKAMRALFAATVAMITVSVFSIVAFAASGPSAGGNGGQQVATTMIDQIKTWVGIIAGVVIVFGAVNAGLGVANQDEAGRNRGFMTMAGGAIMEAVVQVV